MDDKLALLYLYDRTLTMWLWDHEQNKVCYWLYRSVDAKTPQLNTYSTTESRNQCSQHAIKPAEFKCSKKFAWLCVHCLLMRPLITNIIFGHCSVAVFIALWQHSFTLWQYSFALWQYSLLCGSIHCSVAAFICSVAAFICTVAAFICSMAYFFMGILAFPLMGFITLYFSFHCPIVTCNT